VPVGIKSLMCDLRGHLATAGCDGSSISIQALPLTSHTLLASCCFPLPGLPLFPKGLECTVFTSLNDTLHCRGQASLFFSPRCPRFQEGLSPAAEWWVACWPSPLSLCSPFVSFLLYQCHLAGLSQIRAWADLAYLLGSPATTSSLLLEGSPGGLPGFWGGPLAPCLF
jgi:hypothetical protein